jgi:AcrR family transcriptional regulator
MTVQPMPRKVKRRGYDASGRRAAAVSTRVRILAAARNLFVVRGYLGTKMGDVAADAEVALDTVYASVGTKTRLFRLLVETAISGTDRPIPAEKRQYVRAIKEEPEPARKLEMYARAVAEIHGRLAPLVVILRSASAAHEDLAALWRRISSRRASNMRKLVADVAQAGALRPGIALEEAGDVVWAMTSPDLYLLLVVERGWTSELYARWLSDELRRYLLDL